MSRGFVKEDDKEEAPIIPPRAPLPAGTVNYVTSVGLELLRDEKSTLENDIRHLSEQDERERRRALAVLHGRLKLLDERLSSARLLDDIRNNGEVRFGAYVTYTIDKVKEPVTIQLVGVDEADVRQKKISFLAPIAKALTGKKAGETAEFKLGDAIRQLQIRRVNYKE